MRPRVIVCSPYAGDVERNVAYAKEALSHSISMLEAPLASHLLYTQVLDDNCPVERMIGLGCEKAWGFRADTVVFYVDYGMSAGMLNTLAWAERFEIPVEYRTLHRSFEVTDGGHTDIEI